MLPLISFDVIFNFFIESPLTRNYSLYKVQLEIIKSHQNCEVSE